MKKITEQEENEMYTIISQALFSLCENKPNNPIEYLSKTMLQLVGQDQEQMFRKKASMNFRGAYKVLEEINIGVDKLAMQNLIRNFSEHYRVVSKIGTGSFGTVYLCEELKMNDARKAVKIINKLDYKSINLTENTINLLLSLDHPNIVKISDIIEDENFLYIVEDFCEGGDCLNFVINNKIFSESNVKNFTRQIVDGLTYLHQKGLIHRGLKPENILILKKDYNEIDDIHVKICDYGCTSFLMKRSVKEEISTPYYIAPEVINGNYDNKCDIWSVGAVVYTLLSGSPPFDGKEYDVLFKILNQNLEFSTFHSQGAREFISRLMNRISTNRPEAEDAGEDPWLVNGEKESIDDTQAVSIMSHMTKFALGKNLQRSVLSYILSRKLYTENNSKLQKLFKEMDVNGDGVVDVDEMYNKYGKFFPGTVEEEWNNVKKFIDNVDINKNGTIEYSEFLAVSSIINKELNAKMLKEVFNYYDSDKNGFIDIADLREVFEDTNLSDGNLQKMIDDVDKNSDRRISFQEFGTMITKMF